MTGAEIATTIAIGIGAIAAGITAWQKSRSSDRVDVVKDRAEEGLVERLVARADAAEKRADAIGDRYTEAVKENARLRAENEYLKRFYSKAMHDMPEDKRKQWETDFSPLGGPETKP